MKLFMNIIKIIFNIIVILTLVGFTILVLYSSAIARKENTKKLINESYENGYVDACKDFYKGKLKYDLVEHEDGTKTWEKITK